MLPGIEGMADSTARKRRLPHLNVNPKLELCLSELPQRFKGLGSMSRACWGWVLGVFGACYNGLNSKQVMPGLGLILKWEFPKIGGTLEGPYNKDPTI